MAPMAMDSAASPARKMEIINVIKALLANRMCFTTVQDIDREYRQFEEEHIPYRAYGYRNLADFLRTSGQFNVNEQPNGQISVSAKLSDKDQHMLKMIQETKSKNKRPASRGPARPQMYNNQNRPYPYQQQRPNYYLQPQRPYHPAHAMMGYPQANPHVWMAQQPMRPRPPMQQQPMRPRPPMQPQPMMRPQPVFQPPRPVAAPKPVAQVPPPAAAANPASSEFTWKPLPESAMINNNLRHRDWDKIQVTVLNSETTPLTGEAPRVVKAAVPNQAPAATPVAAPAIVPAKPEPKISMPAPTVQPSPISVLITSGPPQIQNRSQNRHFSHTPKGPQKQQYHKNVQSVFTYPAQQIEKNRNRPTVSLQDRLKRPVDSSTELTPPSQKESRDSGNSTMNRRTNGGAADSKPVKSSTTYPVIQEENHELMLRLYDVLIDLGRGIMEKCLPEVFQEITGTSLPANWTEVVSAYAPLFTIDTNKHGHVVYANEMPEVEETTPEDENMELPWAEAHWNLHVTHVTATTMIWGRIIGETFSDRWDQAMTEIESLMAAEESRTKVEEAKKQSMYLFSRDSCWFRVRCRDVDSEGKRMLAFFLDVGHEEWLSVDTLFECPEKYHRIPDQALLFTMFGMENMDGHPCAQPILEKHLLDKAVVAEILTRAEDFEEGMRITAVLYDTSSAEDVNLVELLHEEIFSAAKPPQLNGSGVTQVKITHISERGDVFCQVPGGETDYVQRLLENTVKNEEAMIRNRGLHENGGGDSKTPTRYLVLDRVNDRWCRGVLKVRHPQTALHVMFCIDRGYQMQVPESDIYHLAPLNMALSRFPALAIRCEMHDIPSVDNKLVSRMKELLEMDKVALARVMVKPGFDKIPRVNFYKRLDSNQVFVCINDTLRLENDLQSF